MKRNRRKAAILTVLGTAAIGAVGTIYLATRPKPVLEIARVFCEVKPWSRQTLYPNSSHYYWLSNSEALVVPSDKSSDGAAESLYRVAAGPEGRAGDLKAMPFSPVSNLNVSPDGKSVAYFSWVPGNVTNKPGASAQVPQTYLIVSQIDGKQRMRRIWSFPKDPNGEDIDSFVWAPDSGSLCHLQTGPKPCIRRVAVPSGQIEDLPLPPDLPIPVHVEDTSGNIPRDSDYRILGFTGAASVLVGCPFVIDHKFYDVFGSVTGQSNFNFPRATLVEVSLADKPKVVRTYSPAVPPEIGIGQILLSPSGDRLFWGAFCANKVSPLQSRVHRYLPFVPGDSTLVERGWVSRLDGTELKEVGYYNIPGSPINNTGDNAPWIIDVKWTPDGRRLSFVYKDRIMTISAD